MRDAQLMLMSKVVGLGSGPSLFAPLPGELPSAVRSRAKRGFDLLVSAVLLVLLAPVMLVLAILVRLDGGPAFFGHPRVGRDGRTFACLKFRSMATDSQALLDALLAADPAARDEWAATRKLRRDPRITPIGRFLRNTSLDELPQLLNVLRGDMSLVGPRPVVQAELDQHYGPAAASYLAVRPGMTGLWQVSGRSDVGYADRVALDVAYVRRPSFRNDLSILLRTVLVVARGSGAR